MEECTNVRGWGVRWATASCLWFTRLLLFCLTGRPDCLESPPPTAPAPAATTAAVAIIITAQISVLRSQLHRSHNLDCPLLLPLRHPTAQTSDSRATPPPPREATAFSTSCVHAQTHKRTDWWAHGFFLLSFPFFSYHSIPSPSLHPEKNPLDS